MEVQHAVDHDGTALTDELPGSADAGKWNRSQQRSVDLDS
jgi:hypothetical protein